MRVGVEEAENDEIRFFVSDTGIGIAPEDDGFDFSGLPVQLDHPLQRRFKGTGLGLPLSRKTGDISQRQRRREKHTPGEGSTFTLRIPRHYRDPGEEETGAKPECIVDPSETPVLFVEDSPETLVVYKSHLKGSGFQVIAAATTREAEDVIDRIPPRVIVLDIVLRSEDTWKFLASLKEDPRTKHIPVIVASTIEDQSKGFRLGATSYLVKPVERSDAADGTPASYRQAHHRQHPDDRRQ